MGLTISNLMNRLFLKKEIRILMIGLDGAGKTTVLYKLKLGEIFTTIPTLGFNVETVEYKNCCFTVWDIGGQNKIRRLWHHYYKNAQGIIWVLDSNDMARLDEAATELRLLLNDVELKDVVLLIFANKQDLPNAMKLNEISDKLNLNVLCSKHSWFIQATCAIHGCGLYEGLDWLSTELNKKF